MARVIRVLTLRIEDIGECRLAALMELLMVIIVLVSLLLLRTRLLVSIQLLLYVVFCHVYIPVRHLKFF